MKKAHILLLMLSLLFIDQYGETFDQLCQKSQVFHNALHFPELDNRIAKIAQNDEEIQAEIVSQSHDVRIVMHHSVNKLIDEFLVHKQQYGSSIERNFYKDMNQKSFVERLLVKRPLMFMTESDSYFLRDGTSGYGGFEAIGTDQQKEPLVLSDYISYDEMAIAALIGVSVPTVFINDGSRNNSAQKAINGTYEKKGIYTGLVGARFEKPGLMEWRHMIVTPEQNNIKNGYGSNPDMTQPQAKLLAIWEKFYGKQFETFDQVQSGQRYIKIRDNQYLDVEVYVKRMKLVIEPFLIDANARGKQQNKKVYCHAVGLGLGVWQLSSQQAQYMLQAYADIIQEQKLPWVADIDFSWFPKEYAACGGVKNLDVFKANGNEIKIHFSQRNPAAKLIGNDKDKLLVAMYAWDGNAYPGNEYWKKMWTASGDPAAACCSTISELQNPLINSYIIQNIQLPLSLELESHVSRETIVSSSVVNSSVKSWWSWLVSWLRGSK